MTVDLTDIDVETCACDDTPTPHLRGTAALRLDGHRLRVRFHANPTDGVVFEAEGGSAAAMVGGNLHANGQVEDCIARAIWGT